MVVLPTYMYAYHLHAWLPRRSEEVSGPLELELQMFRSHHVRPGSLASATVFQTAELSLQPPLSDFDLRFLLCGISKDALVVSICMEYPFQHFTFSLCVFTSRMNEYNEYLIVYSRIALLFLNLKFIHSVSLSLSPCPPPLLTPSGPPCLYLPRGLGQCHSVFWRIWASYIRGCSW